MDRDALLITSAFRLGLFFKNMRRSTRWVLLLAFLICGAILTVHAENVTVMGSVSVMRDSKQTGKVSAANAVIWLKSTLPVNRRADSPRPRFKILQQHKRFEPHVIVVPAGSVIDFPNLDPFFHNVFSMFDGKRFDLGLYEAGTSHAVTFDTPGVCYIFCNIHPEMSAAVVVVDSPYYAISNQAGEFSIRNFPTGAYLLNVWHERGKPTPSESFPRLVTITAGNPSLDVIRLIDAGEILANHKNKYGRDYDSDKSQSPIYK